MRETALTPASVGSGNFGKVGFLPVTGLVDAEPLYVSNLRIGGTERKVVFVATEHDLVYAFDAESHALLWKVSLLEPGETTSDNHGCQQVTPEIGITATPVIDLKAGSHGAIYVVAMSKSGDGRYFQRLHALDLTSGAEMAGGPTTIRATYPGRGAGNKSGVTQFRWRTFQGASGAPAFERADLHDLVVTLRRKSIHKLGDRLLGFQSATGWCAESNAERNGSSDMDERIRPCCGRRRKHLLAHWKWDLRHEPGRKWISGSREITEMPS